ncbi:MAG: hypothetical protein FWH26_05400 [Oscillospiraceae bacterium]|nr:hypothetical protein [Oscillospiraceae bacterium]
MENLVFQNEEEYKAWVLQMLEESEREAADPNIRRIPLDEFRKEAEAYFKKMESRAMAKSV